MPSFRRNRRMNRRQTLRYNTIELTKYIEGLNDLDEQSLKTVFRHKNSYPTIRMLYLILKYKFGFVPTFEHLKHRNNMWFRVLLEVLDLPKSKHILFEYIKTMEINNDNINFITKIMKSTLLSNITYDAEIIDYIFSKISENPKLTELIEIIINKNKNIKDDKYLDIITSNPSNKYIYEFNTQKQLLDYIDKIKIVPYKLITKNNKLFTSEELYNFLKGKNYKCRFVKYILKMKKPSVNDIKLLEICNYFDKSHVLPTIYILNRNPFLYGTLDFDSFFNGWHKRRAFDMIIHIVQQFDVMNNWQYDFRQVLNIQEIFNTMLLRLNQINTNNYYDPNYADPTKASKIINKYEEVILFCIYLGLQKSSKEEIYNYLEQVIKILDEQWLYKDNINYRCFTKIFNILAEHI